MNWFENFLPGRSTGNYVYDGSGRKLRRLTGTETVDYIDGIQYRGAAIDFIKTEEGRIYNSSGTYVYEYTLTDYLGNARASFDIDNGTAREIQHDDYYPFALTFNSYASGVKNNYLYNGKELQDKLKQYDYRARFYDPVIDRWGSVDPLRRRVEDGVRIITHSTIRYGLLIQMGCGLMDLEGVLIREIQREMGYLLLRMSGWI